MRSPVNRHDPSGTSRIEREEMKRQAGIIRAYTEAMSRVATGAEEGSTPRLDDQGRIDKLERLRDAMDEDLQASVDDWINNTAQASIDNAQKIVDRMHAGIELGNVPIPREEISLMAVNIRTNVSTIPDSLFKDVTRIMTEAYQAGEATKTTAKRINDLYGIKRSDSERIVRTETMRICDIVDKASFQAAGADGYMSYPTEDDRLCSHCLAMATGGSGNALKVYGLDEPMALPWHPNCRCVRLPHFADDTEVFTI